MSNKITNFIDNAKNGITKVVTGLAIAGGLIVGASSCGEPGEGKGPEGSGPGPVKPVETVYISEVKGRNTVFTLNMADSSLLMKIKEFGATPAEDTYVTVRLSASKNSNGQAVIFDRPLLATDNVKDVTPGGVIHMYDYNKEMSLSKEGKTVAQTPDQKIQVQKIIFTRNTGMSAINMPEGLTTDQATDKVKNILSLPFKIEGDNATLPVNGVAQNFKVAIN